MLVSSIKSQVCARIRFMKQSTVLKMLLDQQASKTGLFTVYVVHCVCYDVEKTSKLA